MNTEQILGIYYLIGFVFHGVATLHAKHKDPEQLPTGAAEWIVLLVLVVTTPWLWPLSFVFRMLDVYTWMKRKYTKG